MKWNYKIIIFFLGLLTLSVRSEIIKTKSDGDNESEKIDDDDDDDDINNINKLNDKESKIDIDQDLDLAPGYAHMVEQLRELRIFRDSMLRLVPSADKNLNDIDSKTSKQTDDGDDNDNDVDDDSDIEKKDDWKISKDLDEFSLWGNEIDDPSIDNDQTKVPLTPEQQQAEELFRKAQALLNSTRSNNAEIYKLITGAATLGHLEARSMLAWAKLLGTDTGLSSASQDIPAALETFTELVETGLPSAHMAMGFFYSMGFAGVNRSHAKALLHYTIGALGGDTQAQMAIGYRHLTGISTVASCEKALDFYRKVANKVAAQINLSGGPIIQRVRLLEEQEDPEYSSGILDDDLIEYYQLLAKRGDVQAQVGLGQLHYQGGRGVPLDHQKALDYFQNAANAGNPIAMAFLGRIYLEGSDIVQQDNETAYKYFAKAAMQNNPVGQSGLGLMYLEGRGVERDATKAFQYFTLAAEQGWVDGQLQLGNMYLTGNGIKRDYKLANKYFNLASQSGHVLAFYNLAKMHATGTGMIRSCSNAVELFKNVGERGKWSNQLMTAHSDYKDGKIDQAFVRYALLAEMGYEVAQSNAAYILDREEISVLSPNQGLTMALSFWARAATQGYSTAHVKLGDAHYYGRGTRVDYEAAVRHYRDASDQQPNAQAIFNLGYMHERGLGLARDRHLAKRKYDLAAEASPDARIPVSLALIKLYFLFGFDFVEEFSIAEYLTKWDQLFGQNWDLYLIGVFAGMLSLIIYFRRPQPHQQQQQQHPQTQPQPQPQPQPRAEVNTPPNN